MARGVVYQPVTGVRAPGYLHALRRYADTLAEAPAPAGLVVRVGTVTAVTPGAAADGAAAVTVTVDGSTLPAPYHDSYQAPAPGHRVSVLLIHGSPLIWGRIIGPPVI